jgi:hypothetical protein
MLLRSAVVAMGLAGAAGVSGGCQVQQPLLVSCTTDTTHVDVIGLDLRQGRATLLSVSPPLAGSAQASPTEYEVLFQPGPGGASRLLFKINRYTLRVTREQGPRSSETGTASSAPSTGTCERYRAKPL